LKEAAADERQRILTEFPSLRVDVVLSTHAHFDHDAVERPNGLVVLERLVGNSKLGDVEVTGLADKHKCEPARADKADRTSGDARVETCPPENVLAFDNAIQIIETGGIRIAIWGYNRAVPDASIDRYLRSVEVLILPIETILTPKEVDLIIRKYDPKAVIPAHYFLRGLTTDVAQLKSAERWVNAQEKTHHADVRCIDSGSLTLNAADPKGSHRRIYYFDDHFSSAGN
jgi:L-ascorbate metabolism protein UlaG (beta-lactamase superfamily)